MLVQFLGCISAPCRDMWGDMFSMHGSQETLHSSPLMGPEARDQTFDSDDSRSRHLAQGQMRGRSTYEQGMWDRISMTTIFAA